MTVFLSIAGIIFTSAMAMFTITHWKPYSWLSLTIHVACMILYVSMLCGQIRRKEQMAKKVICDLCAGDVAIDKNTHERPGFMSLVEAWYAIPMWKIIGVEIIFPFGHNRKELHICSKCMTDFTEFVQKKQSYLKGERL